MNLMLVFSAACKTCCKQGPHTSSKRGVVTRDFQALYVVRKRQFLLDGHGVLMGMVCSQRSINGAERKDRNLRAWYVREDYRGCT